MTRRLSKDDFDATFDAFLKTSVSSEDDTEKINELLRNPRKGRAKDTPWWMEDEDKKKAPSTKSFLKSKKPASADSPGKVKASDNASPSSRSPSGKMAKHAIVKKNKQDRGGKGKASRETSPGSKSKGSRSRGPSDVAMSKDSLEDISEKSEEHELHGHHHGFAGYQPDSSMETTRESVTTDGVGSLVDSDQSPGKLGLDTLDELAEKQKFFQDLEAKANGSLDYSQLNRELSATGTMFSPGTGAPGTNPPPGMGTAPHNDDSPQYSPGMTAANIPLISHDSPPASSRPDTAYHDDGHHDDHDDGLDLSVDKETSSHQKPSMLSRVSLDSTLNTTTSPQAPVPEEGGSRDTTQENLGLTLKTQGTTGGMGTNTSREIEELHQALREVGMSPTLGGQDTRTASTHHTANHTANTTANTHPEAALLSRKPTDRSVGQILEEIDEIRRGQHALDSEGSDVRLMADLRRQHQQHQQQHQQQQQRQQPQQHQLHSGRLPDGDGGDHNRGGGFDKSQDTELYQPVTSVPSSDKAGKRKGERMSSTADTRGSRVSSTPDTRAKTLDDRGRRKSRDLYGHVQSSGYGKRSPEVTPRKSSLSPALSPIRHHTRGVPAAHASLDSTPPAPTSRKGSLSPSPRRPKPRTTTPRGAGGGGGIRGGRGELGVTTSLSEDEPIKSKYTRTGVSGVREDVLIEELKDLRVQLQEERQKNSRLLGDQAGQEREHNRKMEDLRLQYEEQIFGLKQENFVLAARLKDVDAQTGVRGISGDAGDSGVNTAVGENMPPSKEQVARLEKEVKEQEELLARFQAENKRLYEEIRSKEKKGKATEEAMFKENQRLNAELTTVRCQLEQKDSELRSKGIITSLAAQQQIAAGNQQPGEATSARTVHLESDLTEVKRQHNNAVREMKVLERSRAELEKHVDSLVVEREMLKKQLAAARQARPEEIKELERHHAEEVDKLKRKLKWYAENQELLDKCQTTIRDRDRDIANLKQRIADLQTETGKRLEENKLWSKQKSSDAKKMQDLERQVKEMEGIIRRRHPNSLPALMMAAASVPELSEPAADTRGPAVTVLEKRVKKLEADLEKKDEEAATLLRGMEQKYNAVKFQYEERVADLEAQLRHFQRMGRVHYSGLRPSPQSLSGPGARAGQHTGTLQEAHRRVDCTDGQADLSSDPHGQAAGQRSSGGQSTVAAGGARAEVPGVLPAGPAQGERLRAAHSADGPGQTQQDRQE